MKRIIILLATLLALSPLASPAHAEPTKDQLKTQFKAREAELKDLKRTEQVGETVDGYIDAVDAKSASDEKISRLLSEENADRRALYKLLADEINKENPKAPVKATMETIAARNALRNIERAGAEEFLRVAKAHWIRVKDFPRYQKLLKLKTQGKVGETALGLLDIVQEADRADTTLASLVSEENARRSAEYKLLADKEQVDPSAIAKRMAARNAENARIGDMIKDESGTWRKK